MVTRIKEIIKIPKSVRNFLILIVVAFLIKTTILEIYVVPTGSMLDTIEINDVIIGNKFIYGLRTPNWIGIPFTRMGAYIPSTRLPAFKEVDNGDIVIFEFPNDDYVKYVKRCIGLPGQFIEMRDGEIFLSDSESNEPSFQHALTYPPKSRFTKEREGVSKGFSEKSLLDILKMAHNPPFSYYQPINSNSQTSILNQDNMKFKVPHKGMRINLTDEKTDFYSSLMLLLLEGHTVEIQDFEIQENQYGIKMNPNKKYTFHKYDYQSMASTSVTISDFFTKATKGRVGIIIFIFIIVYTAFVVFNFNNKYSNKKKVYQSILCLIVSIIFITFSNREIGEYSDVQNIANKSFQNDIENGKLPLVSFFDIARDIAQKSSTKIKPKSDSEAIIMNEFKEIIESFYPNESSTYFTDIQRWANNMDQWFVDLVRIEQKLQVRAYTDDAEYFNPIVKGYFNNPLFRGKINQLAYDYYSIISTDNYNHTRNIDNIIRRDVLDKLLIDGEKIDKKSTFILAHDYYFMVGDNHNGSSDSRTWGFVPDYNLLGQPVITIFNWTNTLPEIKFETHL